MIKTKTRALLLIGMSIPSSLFAGGSDRGGGNAVVCFKTPETSADILNPANPLRGFILDKHLASIESITSYDLIGMKDKVIPTRTGESAPEYMNRVAERYETWLPHLAKMLRAASQAFNEDNIYEKASPLYRVYDENDTGPVNPEHCVISTMAVQSDVGDHTDLTLDSRLYLHPTHSEQSQKVLMVHEYIYKVFRKNLRDQDSRRTRAFVQAILGESPKNLKELSTRLGKIIRSANAAPLDQTFLVAQGMDQDWRSRIANEFARKEIENPRLQEKIISLAMKFSKRQLPRGNWYMNQLPEQLESLANCPSRNCSFKYTIDEWHRAFQNLDHAEQSNSSETAKSIYAEFRKDWSGLTPEVFQFMNETHKNNMRSIVLENLGLLPLSNPQKHQLLKNLEVYL